MNEEDMNRRATDRSRLHRIAVSPVVNLATIVTVTGMLVVGGMAFGSIQQKVRDQKEDIEEVRDAAAAARNTAEEAKSTSDTLVELNRRVEKTMSTMQADIKEILSNMRRD